MTNEYEKPEMVSLKEYIERIIDERDRHYIERMKYLELQVEALEQLIEAKQQALALAVEKQEAAYNARFDSVNEWRAAFGDVVNRAVPQDVYTARSEEITRRLNNVENRLANFDGRIIGWSAGVGAVVLVITIVINLLNFGG